MIDPLFFIYIGIDILFLLLIGKLIKRINLLKNDYKKHIKEYLEHHHTYCIHRSRIQMINDMKKQKTENKKENNTKKDIKYV